MIKVNYVEGGVDNLRYYRSGGKYWIIDDDHPFALIVIDAKGIILGSLFRAPFDDPMIIRSVLSASKAAGQLVFADTKLPNFRSLKLEDIRDSLPLIDYITPNEDEARYYTEKDTPEEIVRRIEEVFGL